MGNKHKKFIKVNALNKNINMILITKKTKIITKIITIGRVCSKINRTHEIMVEINQLHKI